MDFGSTLATAHQKSIRQNIKILIKILNITEMFKPIAAFYGTKQLKVIVCHVFTSWDFVLDSKRLV